MSRGGYVIFFFATVSLGAIEKTTRDFTVI